VELLTWTLLESMSRVLKVWRHMFYLPSKSGFEGS